MKWRHTIRRIPLHWILLVAVWSSFAGMAGAQGTSEINIENDLPHQETQNFIADTQGIIARVRAETDARAKEIEALTNRVGELISNIGSTNEDVYNLRSELSLRNDLLDTERKTTDRLRRHMLFLIKKLEAQKKNKTDLETRLKTVIASLHAENAKVKKRLSLLETKLKSTSTIEDRLRAKFVTPTAEHHQGVKKLNRLNQPN